MYKIFYRQLIFFLFIVLPLNSYGAVSCNTLLYAKNVVILKKYRVSGKHFSREVVIALPEGSAPKKGWPVIIFYQGSFFKSSFNHSKSALFGGRYESETFQKLLSQGFAVVVPPPAGGLFWQTNLLGVFPNPFRYTQTDDYVFLKNIFEEVRLGRFGHLNADKKFAAGMSSGGYNTSRMAVDFPGEFRALMIHSASYATFGGPFTFGMPPELPGDHPPTLFIHGGSDSTVPVSTMWKYYEKLRASGKEAEVFVKEGGAHEYFKETPELTVKWFQKYR